MAADTAPVRPSLQAYLDRFRPLFPRRDQAASFGVYAEDLLSGTVQVGRAHGPAPAGGDMNQVHRLQYFAVDGSWSDRPFADAADRRWGPSWARARPSC